MKVNAVKEIIPKIEHRKNLWRKVFLKRLTDKSKQLDLARDMIKFNYVNEECSFFN